MVGGGGAGAAGERGAGEPHPRAHAAIHAQLAALHERRRRQQRGWRERGGRCGREGGGGGAGGAGEGWGARGGPSHPPAQAMLLAGGLPPSAAGDLVRGLGGLSSLV